MLRTIYTFVLHQTRRIRNFCCCGHHVPWCSKPLHISQQASRGYMHSRDAIRTAPSVAVRGEGKEGLVEPARLHPYVYIPAGVFFVPGDGGGYHRSRGRWEGGGGYGGVNVAVGCGGEEKDSSNPPRLHNTHTHIIRKMQQAFFFCGIGRRGEMRHCNIGECTGRIKEWEGEGKGSILTSLHQATRRRGGGRACFVATEKKLHGEGSPSLSLLLALFISPRSIGT